MTTPIFNKCAYFSDGHSTRGDRVSVDFWCAGGDRGSDWNISIIGSRMRQRTIRMMVEKGQPVPAELLAPECDVYVGARMCGAGSFGRWWAWA